MYEDEQIWDPIPIIKFRFIKIYVEAMVFLSFIMPFTNQEAHCPECRAVSESLGFPPCALSVYHSSTTNQVQSFSLANMVTMNS